MGIPRRAGLLDGFRLLAVDPPLRPLRLVEPVQIIPRAEADVIIVDDRDDVHEIRRNVRNNVPDGYKNVLIRRTPRAVVDAVVIRHVHVQMMGGGPPAPLPIGALMVCQNGVVRLLLDGVEYQNIGDEGMFGDFRNWRQGVPMCRLLWS